MSPSEKGPQSSQTNENLFRGIFDESTQLADDLNKINTELAEKATANKTAEERDSLLRRKNEIIDRISELRKMTEALMQSGDKDIQA